MCRRWGGVRLPLESSKSVNCPRGIYMHMCTVAKVSDVCVCVCVHPVQALCGGAYLGELGYHSPVCGVR